MVHGYGKSLVYRIPLDKLYDYYYIIPDLEKEYHMRFKLIEGDLNWIYPDLEPTMLNQSLEFLSFSDSHPRFNESNYNKNNPEYPDDSYVNKLIEVPLSLTTNEQDIIDQVPDFLETIGVGVSGNGAWYVLSKFY